METTGLADPPAQSEEAGEGREIERELGGDGAVRGGRPPLQAHRGDDVEREERSDDDRHRGHGERHAEQDRACHRHRLARDRHAAQVDELAQARRKRRILSQRGRIGPVRLQRSGTLPAIRRRCLARASERGGGNGGLDIDAHGLGQGCGDAWCDELPHLSRSWPGCGGRCLRWRKLDVRQVRHRVEMSVASCVARQPFHFARRPRGPGSTSQSAASSIGHGCVDQFHQKPP